MQYNSITSRRQYEYTLLAAYFNFSYRGEKNSSPKTKHNVKYCNIKNLNLCTFNILGVLQY